MLQNNSSSKTAKVAFDIGSGGIKVLGAVVDTQNREILEIRLDKRLPIQFGRDMRLNQGAFSPEIMDTTFKALEEVKSELDVLFQDMLPLTHQAVATAAFRQASNAGEFARRLSERLAFDVQIIDQKSEGLLAYYGVKCKSKYDPIVFDLGGGSIQFTYQLGSKYEVIGIPYGVESFTGLLQQKFASATSESLNPFDHDKIYEASLLARRLFEPHESDLYKLRELIENKRTVVCTGAVHNIAIYKIMEKLLGEKIEYTKDNLEQMIKQLMNKTDAELQTFEPLLPYAQIQLPTLILTLEIMKALDLEKMEVMNVGNTHGMLVNPSESVSFASTVDGNALNI